MEKLLVIKLSALGDFILALGPMQAIRRHHPSAHITLLTTVPFADLARKSGYFNEVIVDRRPKLFDFGGWYRLFRTLNAGGYTRVYDLQMNDRTGIYARLFTKKPEWSGVRDAELKKMHAFRRHQEVLKKSGIDMSLPDLSWMTSDVSHFGLKKPYVLLIPGSAPAHPEKRWPALRYGALGLKLMKEGYQVAVIGTKAEEDVIGRVVKAGPGIIDLSGRTALEDIATLARGAAGVVGNDTGPTHLAALSGAPTLVLFSTQASDPALSAPIGTAVEIIQSDNLDRVSVGDVYKNFHPRKAA